MTTLTLPPTRPGSRILGVGGYRPERVVPNAEIVDAIDSSDEWIRERSGIIERRYAAVEETVIDMAVEAAGKALANAGVTADTIDLVLLASISYTNQTPSAAAQVADRLGARGAGAVDLGAACAGFSYGVATADALVRSGASTNVLVIGSEKLTDLLNPRDRGTAFIFGDGAGAVVVGPSLTPGIGPVVWGADGSQKDAIGMSQTWVEHANSPGSPTPWLTMEGQVVYRWAIREMTAACNQAIAAAGLTSADIDVFVPHQANMRITDALVRAVRFPDSVVVARDIETTGNTSAASIPLALARLMESGSVKSGDTALFVGFGAGLVHAAQVVILP